MVIDQPSEQLKATQGRGASKTFSAACFGGQRLSTGSLPTDRLFTDQIRDLNDDRFYFFQSRYYDATIGKFVAPDSIVPGADDPQALNRYAYALNNPLKLVDLSGHDAMDPDWVKRFAQEHARDPNPQDWADYQFSLHHAGRGPNGTWTSDDWTVYGKAQDILGYLEAGIGKTGDLGTFAYTDLGSLFSFALDGTIPGHAGPDGTWILVGDAVGIPPNAVATTYGNIILLRPAVANDRALLAHEYVHVLQYRALGKDFLPDYAAQGFGDWKRNAFERQAVAIEDLYRVNSWLPDPWYFPWAGGHASLVAG